FVLPDHQPDRRRALRLYRSPGAARMNTAAPATSGAPAAELLLPEAEIVETLPGRAGLLRRLARDPIAATAALGLAAIILAALFAPWVAPYDPYYTDLSKVMLEPSAEHWFGTDPTGRDILSRCLYGARNTLLLGFVGVIGGGLIGGIMGIF